MYDYLITAICVSLLKLSTRYLIGIWKMPNNCLSVLYKHIIQVENKNVGLKVGGHKHTIAPPNQKSGGAHAPLASPLPTPVSCSPKKYECVRCCNF